MTCRNASARQPLFVLGAALLVSCSADSPKARMEASADSAASHPARPVVAPMSVDAASAEPSEPSWRDTLTPALDSLAPAYRQFASFLDYAVATRVPHVGMVDSLYSRGSFDELGIAEQDNDMRWLAASRILWVRTVSDTGQAMAVITTVARQTPESEEGSYAVQFGIRDDTANWKLVRDADDGRWKVDGDGWIRGSSRGQFTVLSLGRDLHWVAGSREQALATVDSIRLARGLELVR